MNYNGNIKIAIIDNHFFSRVSLRELCTAGWGFTVLFEAKNGKDFLAVLKNATELPDLCILDTRMPVMNGFETVRILKSLYPSIKILAFSFETHRGAIEQILASGADLFISKAIASDKLRASIISLTTTHGHLISNNPNGSSTTTRPGSTKDAA